MPDLSHAPDHVNRGQPLGSQKKVSQVSTTVSAQPPPAPAVRVAAGAKDRTWKFAAQKMPQGGFRLQSYDSGLSVAVPPRGLEGGRSRPRCHLCQPSTTRWCWPCSATVLAHDQPRCHRGSFATHPTYSLHLPDNLSLAGNNVKRGNLRRRKGTCSWPWTPRITAVPCLQE